MAAVARRIKVAAVSETDVLRYIACQVVFLVVVFACCFHHRKKKRNNNNNDYDGGDSDNGPMLSIL